MLSATFWLISCSELRRVIVREKLRHLIFSVTLSNCVLFWSFFVAKFCCCCVANSAHRFCMSKVVEIKSSLKVVEKIVVHFLPGSVSRIVSCIGTRRHEILHCMQKWNSQLAQLAQTWADNCVWGHGQPQFDPATVGYEDIGQNIYYYSPYYLSSPTAVVQKWFNEKSDYNYGSLSCAAGETCTHYTQVS